jgi:hypothetical protein
MERDFGVRFIRASTIPAAGENTTAPRAEIYGGPGWLVSGDYKLLVSPSEVYAVWTGPRSPNATTRLHKQFFCPGPLGRLGGLGVP